MNVEYQIRFTGKFLGVAYARNIADCDSICDRMIDEGIYPVVRRIKKSRI
jgi:hypothetical protein